MPITATFSVTLDTPDFSPSVLHGNNQKQNLTETHDLHQLLLQPHHKLPGILQPLQGGLPFLFLLLLFLPPLLAQWLGLPGCSASSSTAVPESSSTAVVPRTSSSIQEDRTEPSLDPPIWPASTTSVSMLATMLEGHDYWLTDNLTYWQTDNLTYWLDTDDWSNYLQRAAMSAGCCSCCVLS